jgi:hypothetical protein
MSEEVPIVHHTADTVCPLCEQKLKTAHPYMASWFHQIKHNYPNAHISWAWRNKEEQEECFANGKTKDHWPHSQHNHLDAFGKPQSYALDLFEIVNEKALFDPIFYAKVNVYNETLGLPVLWGEKFRNLGDRDHFQYDSSINPVGMTVAISAA